MHLIWLSKLSSLSSSLTKYLTEDDLNEEKVWLFMTRWSNKRVEKQLFYFFLFKKYEFLTGYELQLDTVFNTFSLLWMWCVECDAPWQWTTLIALWADKCPFILKCITRLIFCFILFRFGGVLENVVFLLCQNCVASKWLLPFSLNWIGLLLLCLSATVVVIVANNCSVFVKCFHNDKCSHWTKFYFIQYILKLIIDGNENQSFWLLRDGVWNNVCCPKLHIDDDDDEPLMFLYFSELAFDSCFF